MAGLTLRIRPGRSLSAAFVAANCYQGGNPDTLKDCWVKLFNYRFCGGFAALQTAGYTRFGGHLGTRRSHIGACLWSGLGGHGANLTARSAGVACR